MMNLQRVSTIACGIALAATIGLGAGIASAQSGASLPVAIISGTCADPGAVVYQLREARPTSGTQQGSMEAIVVLESDTELDISLDSLLSQAHAIVVGDPAAPQACGDIGGVVDDDEDLSIGLAPLNTPDAFGIAHLDGDDDDDDELDIKVFVAVPAS